MTELLADPDLVAAWARDGQRLVGLDYDGTLAPIVDHPADAALSARTDALLVALAARRPVVVLSGRAGADLARRLAHVALAAVIGNHGAELGGADDASLRRVGRWRDRLRGPLAALPGIELEDKGLSLSVHMRRAPDPLAAEGRVRAILAALAPDARLVAGKELVNVVLPDRPHKGQAIRAAMDALACPRALYVGDDWTDEDVFALDDPAIAGVRVGREPRSRAPWYLTARDDVDLLLARLAAG